METQEEEIEIEDEIEEQTEPQTKDDILGLGNFDIGLDQISFDFDIGI